MDENIHCFLYCLVKDFSLALFDIERLKVEKDLR